MVIKTERLPAPGETILGGDFLMNPGGKGANQAVAAARMGGDVVFVARVGNDMFGQGAIENFKASGIRTDNIVVDPDKPSGVATITVDAKGENCIAVASGANDVLSPEDVNMAMDDIDSANVLLMQLETPMDTIEHAVVLGNQKGKQVILNPAPAQLLSDSLLTSLDVITPNETEAEILTGIKVESLDDAGKAARILHNKGVSTVILTLGPRGAYVLSDTYTGLVPVRDVEVVDTTAAGDTFNGALAVAIADGKSIEDAVVFANEAATLSVMRMGAQASIPYLEELDR
jgi:ribokinase